MLAFIDLFSISVCVQPTVAISGAVKMFAQTSFRLRGMTSSPRMWFTAIRPCIAATEARGIIGVQSPAA